MILYINTNTIQGIFPSFSAIFYNVLHTFQQCFIPVHYFNLNIFFFFISHVISFLFVMYMYFSLLTFIIQNLFVTYIRDKKEESKFHLRYLLSSILNYFLIKYSCRSSLASFILSIPFPVIS